MPLQTRNLIEFVQTSLVAKANARKAKEMAAYMKTDMPFYGVQKPDRLPVYAALKQRFAIETRRDYVSAVESLWRQPHREEKYTALHIAGSYPQFITPASLPLYKRLIVEGAWWDFVDGIAIDLVGRVMLDHRVVISPKMERWVDDDNMWIRRTAIICQIKHKQQTNQKQLFDFCLRRAHEKEFFIRKAIGWALRQHARIAPKDVGRFLLKNRTRLSPLSFREGAKYLNLD